MFVFGFLLVAAMALTMFVTVFWGLLSGYLERRRAMQRCEDFKRAISESTTTKEGRVIMPEWYVKKYKSIY